MDTTKVKLQAKENLTTGGRVAMHHTRVPALKVALEVALAQILELVVVVCMSSWAMNLRQTSLPFRFDFSN